MALQLRQLQEKRHHEMAEHMVYLMVDPTDDMNAEVEEMEPRPLDV